MLRGLLLALCALAMTASAAVAAAEDEIFVDPGSPSGEEYALPVDSARKQAAGDAQARSDNKSAPLFGEGVGDATAGPAAGGGSVGGGGAGGDAARTSGGAREPRSSRTGAGTRPALRAQAAAVDGGGVGLAAVGGTAAGVLLLGGAIGLLLRRRALRAP